MNKYFRALLGIFFIALLMEPATAGNFFPPEYKTFRYKEGDVLAFENKGKYAIERILKVDRIVISHGQTVNIQGKLFTVPEDDFLLVVGTSFSDSVFSTLEEARVAVKNKSWKVKIGHVPRRTPGIGENATYIGNYPVSEGELEGYRQWKEAFDKGKAGIF